MNDKLKNCKIWECKIFISDKEIPNGSDYPPRAAAISAVESIGLNVEACSSGWGSEEFTQKIVNLKRRIVELQKRLAEVERELEDANANLVEWNDLTLESQGVVGYHLNGDIAEWDEFEFTTASPLVAAEDWKNKFAIEQQSKAIEDLHHYLLHEFVFKRDYSFGNVGFAIASFEEQLRQQINGGENDDN